MNGTLLKSETGGFPGGAMVVIAKTKAPKLRFPMKYDLIKLFSALLAERLRTTKAAHNEKIRKINKGIKVAKLPISHLLFNL